MPFRNIYPPRNGWEKLQFWLAWLSLLLWWGLVSIIAVMAADRGEPVTNLQGRFLGWNEHNPRIGTVEWTGERKRSCDGWSYRQIVNGHVVDLTPIKITRYDLKPEQIGKVERWVVDFEVPRDFDHAGHYRIRPEYYCNAFHRALWPIQLTPPDVAFPPPVPTNATSRQPDLLRRSDTPGVPAK